MSETNNNGNKNEKKGFLNGIKNLVNKGKEKVANFKEKHPVAYKVVGGVIVVGTAAAAGTVAYNLAKNADEKKNTETINVPLIDSGNNEPVKVDNNMANWEKADQEDWEQNKENWTKVIKVANDLDLKPGNGYEDDYHIYKNDNGVTEVAHITDDGTYHYPPKDYSVQDSNDTDTEASEG